MIRSPRYTNDLIRSNRIRQGGPAVVDATGLAAAHTIQQQGVIDQTQQQGRQLGLAQDSLDENGRRFDANMGMARSDMQFNKDQGNTANLLAVGGLGLAGLGAYKGMKRDDEVSAIRKRMIERTKGMEPYQAQFWQDLINYENRR